MTTDKEGRIIYTCEKCQEQAAAWPGTLPTVFDDALFVARCPDCEKAFTLTEQELAAIRFMYDDKDIAVLSEVPKLLAEVERLRASAKEVVMAYDDCQSEQCDELCWDAFRESQVIELLREKP